MDKDFYVDSIIGLRLNNHAACFMIDCSDHKESWASRRRSELIYKIKSIRANWNKALVGLLMLLAVVVVFGTLFLICLTGIGEITAIVLGYTGAQALLLAWTALTYYIPCNPWDIKIKRER